MKKFTAVILIIFFIAAPFTSVQAATFKKYKVIVTTSRLNIRSTASTRGKLTGYYYKNNIVDVIGQTGSWLKTSKGYILSSYTKKYTASAKTASTSFKSYKAIVTTSRLNIRSIASTSGKLTGYYYKGNIVNITGQSGSWLKTSKGYISSVYAKKYTAAQSMIDEMVTPVSRGTTDTSSPIVKTNSEIGNPEFYNSNRKEIAAFPVTQMRTPSTGNSNEELVLDYSVEKNGTSLQITLNNTSTAREYMNSFNTLKKNISIKTTPENKVIITADFAENTDANVYTVRKKASTVNSIQYLKTYIVISFSAQSINQSPDTTTLQRPMVVIDPGHGGPDPGACANGLKEKDLNLDISLKLKQSLESQGYDTYITRSTDTFVELLDRANLANLFKADLFVSVHNNANGTFSYSGTTVLYNSTAVLPANNLAGIMQTEIVQALGTNTLRLEDRPGLVVLNSTWVPSVLAEVAVITNLNDAVIISQDMNRQIAAEAMTRAINRYFGFQ